MKKLFFCAAVIAAAAFGVMKVTDVDNNIKMNVLQLENLELLAEGESDGVLIRKKYRESSYDCYFERDTYKFADGTVVSGKKLDPYVLIQAHGAITYHSRTSGTYPAINCPSGSTSCIEIKCD